MSRRPEGPRIWVKPAEYDKKTGKLRKRAVRLVLDGREEISRHAADDVAGAQRSLGEYLLTLHQPGRRRGQDIREILITDVLAVYAEDVLPNIATGEKAKSRLLELGEWWVGKTLADVTGKTCRAYRDHRCSQPWKSAKPEKTGKPPRMVSNAGVRRELEDLRAAVNHHRKEGLHRELVEVWLPPRGDKRDRWLRRVELAKLIRTMWRAREQQTVSRGALKGTTLATRKRPWRHLARWTLLAYYTGSRAGVVSSASFVPGIGRSHIDLQTGVFTRLEGGKKASKNKRKPPIPLPRRILAHLERWRRLGISNEWVIEFNGEKVCEVNKGFAAAAEAAGFDGEVVPHILRHSCATHLMLLGCELREAAFFLGMSEQMLEERYGHYHPAYQAETRARLDRRTVEAVPPAAPLQEIFNARNKSRAA